MTLAKSHLLAPFAVSAWMGFSSFFIILMKQTLVQDGFPFPLALTSLHMASCWVAFTILRHLAPCGLRSKLMPDAEVAISSKDFREAILPIGLCNAGGLAFGNLAVRVSSVAFLQMIKPANLVWGSLAAFALGIEPPTATHVIIVATVVTGVTIASYTNAEFVFQGFMLQILATMTEGIKLALVQNVTSKRLKLDPLTTIHRYAPIAFVCLLCLSVLIEGFGSFNHFLISWPLVLMNCSAAVILNVLIVGTIACTSAVVFMLAGVAKDIVTIGASVLVFGSIVGLHQLLGFMMSLVGILLYKLYKQHLSSFLHLGFFGGLVAVLAPEAHTSCSKNDIELRMEVMPADVEVGRSAASHTRKQ